MGLLRSASLQSGHLKEKGENANSLATGGVALVLSQNIHWMKGKMKQTLIFKPRKHVVAHVHTSRRTKICTLT